MIKLYGIKNCSTVKKACVWLDDKGINYEFVDFKKTPPSETKIGDWIQAAGIETVINKRGTTWKKLTDEQKTAVLEHGNLSLITENPSTIKRPVLETQGQVHFGFAEQTYQSLFS